MEAQARGIRRRVTFEVTNSLRRRFDAKVLRRSGSHCWQWVGAVRNGYGAIKHDGHTLGAHVVAYVMSRDEHPGDREIVCHTCDNRLCVNPEHLYVGSYADNVRDADKRRRVPRPHGEQMYNAVLTDEMCSVVLALNIARSLGPWCIADLLGCHRRTIEKVLYRETWKHVSIPTAEEAADIVERWEVKTSSSGPQGSDGSSGRFPR